MSNGAWVCWFSFIVDMPFALQTSGKKHILWARQTTQRMLGDAWLCQSKPDQSKDWDGRCAKHGDQTLWLWRLLGMCHGISSKVLSGARILTTRTEQRVIGKEWHVFHPRGHHILGSCHGSRNPQRLRHLPVPMFPVANLESWHRLRWSMDLVAKFRAFQSRSLMFLMDVRRRCAQCSLAAGW